jgi:flagellar biosynthesis GTPase FlhF
VVGVIVLISVTGAVAGGGNKRASSEPSTSAQDSEQTPATPPVALKLDTGDYAVTNSHTTIRGKVTAGASVTVEGSHAHVHGTHWSKTVALQIGSNVVNVEATMAGREPGNRTITVTRHHTQAELEARARARKEREQREKEGDEQREREEQEQNEIEDASVSQQNALGSAESYLETSAFSKTGLIKQLSSEAGEGFPYEDAVWAVDHLKHMDWDEQAARSAKGYLETSSFSCQGMINQLSSEAGEGFTLAQAEYGARQVGLC